METACDASYDDLADEYRRLVVLQRRVYVRMLKSRPGSVAGATLSRAHAVLDARIDTARRMVLNHPDAPPQG